MRGRLQLYIKLSLRPYGPDLLVQEVSSLFRIKREIVVPKDLGEHQPQFSIRQVTSNAVPDANRPGLKCGVVVICEHRIGLVEVSLWDKFVRFSKVVVREVGAKVTDTNTSLESSDITTSFTCKKKSYLLRNEFTANSGPARWHNSGRLPRY